MTLSVRFLQFLLSVIGKNRFYLQIPHSTFHEELTLVSSTMRGRGRIVRKVFNRVLHHFFSLSLSWPNMDRKLPFYYPYYTVLPIYLDLRESVKFALLSVNQDTLVTSSPLYGLSFRIVVLAFSTTPRSSWRFIISILSTPSCQFIKI